MTKSDINLRMLIGGQPITPKEPVRLSPYPEYREDNQYADYAECTNPVASGQRTGESHEIARRFN